MPAYELGLLTTGVASGSPSAEIRAGASLPMTILELGLFLNAATATTLALGRPGNTPVGGTPQTANPSDQSGGTSSGGIVLSGWSTTPTAPSGANTHRQLALPAGVGNGMVWTWEPGELIVPAGGNATSLLLWNLAASSALRLYLKWRE